MHARGCEICGSNSREILHRQAFIFPNLGDELFYNVVSCSQCGFVFADNTPNQKVLDSFYESAEHHLHSLELPSGIAKIHKSFFNYIEKQVPDIKNVQVLDIGSAMGHFLRHFKNAGITKIQGLEPSQAAKKLAKEYYDIDIITNNLTEFVTTRKFDLITLIGVLEHIESLTDAIEKIDSLLNINGMVFIAVPDVEKFGDLALKEPFLEFSLEHINFFSQYSLANLFDNFGFELVAGKSEYNEFYNNYYLLAVFKKKTNINENKHKIDSSSKFSALNYIFHSNQLLNDVNAHIEKLCNKRQPLIVWGAGSYATRLCATTALRKTNLLGFVDKNPQLQGKKLLNKTIYSPEWIVSHPNATILIASSTYADTIEADLKSSYAWQGDILRF